MKNHFFAVALLIIAVCASSCTATKDSHALMRVEGKEMLFNQVGQRWAKENPCVPASPVLIPGRTVHDTTYSVSYFPQEADSILQAQCPAINIDSLKKVLKKALKPDTVHIDNSRVDTVQLPDPRALNILQNNLSNLQGKYDQQTAQLLNETKRGSKWLWLFIAACVVIVVDVFLRIKSLFK